MTLALVALTACEQQWDDAPKYEPATEEQITADGYTLMTVNDFKNQYFYNHAEGSAQPSNLVKSIVVPDKVFIKTKVISSDELGNTYRSIYLQDATGYENGAIEVKVGKGSMYTIYKPGQVLYVKCDGLHLGNYRWMLSLGGASSDAKYSNGYIDIQTTIDEKLLAGELAGLTAADTLVINSTNVKSIIDNDKKYLGTLCRFEGLESVWGTVKHDSYSTSDVFPSFLESLDGEYTNYVFSDYKELPEYPNGLDATWAFCYTDQTGKNNSYYGSALFKFTDTHPFIVRTSGYSKFALEPIPADGEVVDMTAILCKYCENSTTPKYTKYQLLLNSADDVEVK